MALSVLTSNVSLPIAFKTNEISRFLIRNTTLLFNTSATCFSYCFAAIIRAITNINR